MTAAPVHRKRRTVGLILVGSVLLPALLLTVAYVVATSDFGERRLKEWVVSLVNDRIDGRVSVGDLDIHGRRLVLHDVSVFGPHGQSRIAHAERLSATLQLTALLHRELRFTDVAVTKPRLTLVADDTGLNLARALSGRTRADPKRKGHLPVALTFSSMRISDGALSFHAAQAPERSRVIVDAVGGQVSLNVDGSKAEASVQLSGQVRSPLSGPFRLDAEGALGREGSIASVALNAAGVEVRGAAAKRSNGELFMLLNELVLPRDAAVALLAGYPVEPNLRASGTLHRRNQNLTVNAQVAAGSSTVHAHAAAVLSEQRLSELSVIATDLNIHELFGSGPRTALSFTAQARGAADSLKRFEGRIALQSSASTIENAEFGQLTLKAHVNGGVLRIDSLQAQLPGAHVAVTGTASRDDLRLKADFDASSLRAFAHFVEPVVGAGIPALQGTGEGTLTVSGPPSNPAAHLSGRASKLRHGEYAARRLAVEITVPELASPRHVNATFHLRDLRVGSRRLGQARGSLKLVDHRYEASARLSGRLAARVHTQGELAGKNLVGTLRAQSLESSLRVRYALPTSLMRNPSEPVHIDAHLDAPDARALSAVLGTAAPLRLEGPLSARLKMTGSVGAPKLAASAHVAALRIKDADVPVEAWITATSDGRQTHATVRARSSKGTASVDFSAPRSFTGLMKAPSIHSFNTLPFQLSAQLQSFPVNALATRSSGLGGRLSGDLRWKGSLEAPDATGSVQLTDGSLGRMTFVEVQSSFTATGQRLSARATLSGTAASEPPVTTTATLAMTGTLQDPKLMIEGTSAATARGESFAARFKLAYADGSLRAQVVSEDDGGELGAEGTARVNLSLPALRRGITVQEVPMQLVVTATNYNVRPLAVLMPSVSDLEGRLDARAQASGTLRSPDYSGHLAWRDGLLVAPGYGGYRDIQLNLSVEDSSPALLTLKAHAGDGVVSLQAEGKREGGTWRVSGHTAASSCPLFVNFNQVGAISGSAAFSGELTRRGAMAEVDLSKLHIALPTHEPARAHELPRSPDIIEVHGGAEVAAADHPKSRRYPITVSVTSSDPVRAEGPDLKLKGRIVDVLRVEYRSRTLVYGELQVDEGTIEIVGTPLEVLSGARFRFTGPMSAPYVKVPVRRAEEPKGSADNEAPWWQYRALTTETDVRRLAQRGASRRPTSLVGSWATTFALRVVSLNVPLEVLAPRPGVSAGTSSLQTRTYLTDELFLGYSESLMADVNDGENTEEVSGGIHVGRAWHLQLDYGNAGAADANLIWSRGY